MRGLVGWRGTRGSRSRSLLAILAPLIVPLFSLQLGQEDIGVTPTSTTERQAYDLLTRGFGVGYNGPLLVAMRLDPAAKPSAGYTRKYDEATSLQARAREGATAPGSEQAALEQRQAELEAEQAQPRATGRGAGAPAGDVCERQAAELEAAASRPARREENRLRAGAERLAEQARPIVAHLAFILVRERLVRRLIEQTTDPDKLERLRARLARLERKEARTRARLAPLVERGQALLAEAERLRAEGEALEALRPTRCGGGPRRSRAKGPTLQEQADELQTAGQRALGSRAATLQNAGRQGERAEAAGAERCRPS